MALRGHNDWRCHGRGDYETGGEVSTILWQIIIGVVMIAIGAVVQIWIIRWQKREALPADIVLLKSVVRDHGERIDRNEKDLVTARGQIKFIQGVLNGKHWRQGGADG
jgi:hypothetical protein